MPTTTRLSLPYPAASDPPNGPAQVQALAEALDGAAIDLAEGTLGARPVPSIRGRWYYATDVAVLYRDSGSTWRAVTLTDDSVTAARIAADAVGNSELAPNAVTNTEVAAGAAIAKSKLEPLDLVNADVSAIAAIAKSKLAPLNLVNADVAAAAAIAESKLALASDAAAGTASRRSLGSGATQAAPGNDARFSDQRVPTDNSVTQAKMADNSVGSAELIAASVGTSELDQTNLDRQTKSGMILATAGSNVSNNTHQQNPNLSGSVNVPRTGMILVLFGFFEVDSSANNQFGSLTIDGTEVGKLYNVFDAKQNASLIHRAVGLSVGSHQIGMKHWADSAAGSVGDDSAIYWELRAE